MPGPSPTPGSPQAAPVPAVVEAPVAMPELVQQVQAPEPVKAPEPLDPGRRAIALADWQTLRYRLARPEMAAHMLPWRPRVPQTEHGTHCQACGAQIPTADHRSQHAVECEVRGPSRAKCVAWSLGLPLGARP